MSGWTVASEAASCLNSSLSIARRFRVVRSTGRDSGFEMSREHITGRWSEDRLWQTDTERRRESSSLWTTMSRVWAQRWVGTLTAWEKRKVYSMSMICTVLELLGQSKWKLKSPTISTLPPRRLQCSRKSQNSEKKADSVSLFFFEGGGLHRRKKWTSCGEVTVSWASSKDELLNRRRSKGSMVKAGVSHNESHLPLVERGNDCMLYPGGVMSTHLASYPWHLNQVSVMNRTSNCSSITKCSMSVFCCCFLPNECALKQEILINVWRWLVLTVIKFDGLRPPPSSHSPWSSDQLTWSVRGRDTTLTFFTVLRPPLRVRHRGKQNPVSRDRQRATRSGVKRAVLADNSSSRE